MSEEDYTFARFMESVPKSKYHPILEAILFDRKIQATQKDRWNYYGEDINQWYPELLQRVRDGGFEIRDRELHINCDYDVALSFAGEDRNYVEQVAQILHQLDLRVFYDRYEEANLWGKDLYVHLDECSDPIASDTKSGFVISRQPVPPDEPAIALQTRRA